MDYVASDHQLTPDRLHRSIGSAALTSGDMPPAPAARSVPSQGMHILARDMEVLKLVARFGQLSTPQIRTLIFHEQRSRTPCDHTLRRLEKNGLLALVNQPLPGGRQGGRNVNVYNLGAQGWPIFMEGRRKVSRVVSAHRLAIADVYIQLVQAQRDKQLKVVAYATEPDSHLELGGAYLKPDLYVDLIIRQPDDSGIAKPLWIEVDLGTERQKQLLEQVAAYKAAWHARADYPLDRYPGVLFVATSDDRAREITYWLKRAGEAADMFGVTTPDELLTVLQRN